MKKNLSTTYPEEVIRLIYIDKLANLMQNYSKALIEIKNSLLKLYVDFISVIYTDRECVVEHSLNIQYYESIY
jgi:hypothetical protein